jgi:LysE type translocator
VLELLLASLLIMGSPGPATISLTAAGSAYGLRRSLGYLAGIVVGTGLVLLAVATGITAALLAVPAMHPVLIGISAAYILWLAYKVATAPALAAGAGTGSTSFAGGALLGVANPKAWVAIAAVFASAGRRRGGDRRGREGRPAERHDRPHQHGLARRGRVARSRPSRPAPGPRRQRRPRDGARRRGPPRRASMTGILGTT